jgi:hypothetical protein
MKMLAAGMLALCLSGAGRGAIAADATEGPNLTTADLPADVRTTFEKQAKGAPVQELRRENLNGQPVYSGQIIRKGRGTALLVSAQGKVVFRGKPEHGRR